MMLKIGDSMPVGYLRCAQAARYLGISPRTLKEWQAGKMVPFSKLSPRLCLFKIADLDGTVERLANKAKEA